MVRTQHGLLLLLALVGSTPFAVLPADAATQPYPPLPRPSALRSKVNAHLRPLVDLEMFNGVVLIARGRRVLLEQGYGLANVELGAHNTPDKVFRVASISKAFTEVLLARLAQEGVFSLEDPLRRFLPAFPRGDSITLKLLMSHRAGIPNLNSIPFDEEEFRPNSLDSLVRTIAASPLDFPPGSRSRYTNGGYAVLAAVIEKATGRPYGVVLEEKVLRPLGLEHTRHEADGTLVPNRTYGYMPSELPPGHLVPAPFQQMNTKTGGGSLVSTAGDLHRFLLAFFHDNVVPAATWRGLFSDEDSTTAFQGRCPGYNVFMARDLRDSTIVIVLANNYAAGVIARIAADLGALAKGREVAPLPWRAGVPLDRAAATRDTGRFVATKGTLPFGPQAVLEVRAMNGMLVALVDGTPVDVLVPQGPGRYLLRNLCSEWVVLPRDAAGGIARTELRYLYRSASVELARRGEVSR